MKPFMKLWSCPRRSSAKVVDGKLILSFPAALKPVLWQMDLAGAKASALEVEHRDAVFVLVLKTPKGEAHDVAGFENKNDAVDALMAVGGALEKAHGQIRPPEYPRSQALVPVPDRAGAGPHDGPGVAKWLAGLTGIVILALMINALWTMSPRAPVSVTSASSVAPQDAAPTSATDKTGVPVSADDFLRGQ